MFKKFFKKKSADNSTDIPLLSPALTASMMQFLGARGLPTMPGSAQKAFELSINPNAEARDFVEVIKSDEGLTARILKIANSVYFERGKKSETIEDAVLVIGLTEIRGLLNASSLKDLFPSKHPAREQFWANDIATAIIAKVLARRVANDKAELAFTAGLMHDLGKLLMLQRAPDLYDKILKAVREQGHTFHEAEHNVFVFNHCDLGQLIAEKWNFSSELMSALAQHHRNWTEQDLQGIKSPDLATIIKSADIIAHAIGCGHTTGFVKFQNKCSDLVASALKVIGIKSEESSELLTSLKKTYSNEAELYL